jgi:hypothetical protein
MLLQMLEMLWTSNGLHPIFIYIPIKVQMLLTLKKPYVMFPLNFLIFIPLIVSPMEFSSLVPPACAPDPSAISRVKMPSMVTL